MFSNKMFQIAVLLVAVGPVGLVLAQQQKPEPPTPQAASGHHEVPRDRYIPVPRGSQPTTPGGRWAQGRYVSIQVNVDANGDNIVGDAANEPSIAVDPTNPHKMAIGWRQFDAIASDFRQAGWGYTADGGQTWTFPGVIEPGHFRSDPVLGSDADGVFYYNSLTNEGGYQCKVFRSYDGGATWDLGTYAFGGDKQWMVIDQSNSIGRGNIYAFWTEFYSICSGNFTRSYDGGTTFVDCTTAAGSPMWGTFAVGSDGTLHVCGDGFGFAKSTTLKDSSLPAQWQFSTTVSLGGSMVMSSGPNPGGLLGQVWLAVDASGGPREGYLYMLCSVDPSGADPLDVMFARSTNGGTTWSAPVRVNDDPAGNGAWQWFGTMSIAPNGRLDVAWNDTRNHAGTYLSELFYSHSEDGGLTWSTNEQLTPSWDPHLGSPQQNKIGDYYHMVSDNRGADLAFSTTLNGEQDVYYMRIGEPLCSDAGTIALDRPRYACESTATITVNDCGLNANSATVETAQVTIASTSEPTGETVLLTETGPATALFVGAVQLSGANSPGVLLVSPGDTVAATYIDADDGAGHTNVVVTAAAVVDCTLPTISNVHATEVAARTAKVVFDTNELARGTVHYGLSCGSLGLTATAVAYSLLPTVSLTGLADDTTYYYSVEAEDQAGNVASDNNAGLCYSFATLQVPDYYTQLFSADNDLDNLSLIFTPNGSSDFYHACNETIATLPTDPAGGTTLSLTDDSYATVSVSGGNTVKLYGASYTQFYVGSNGYITFSSGDSTYTEALDVHFNQPRVSALLDDLDSSQGGTLSWKQLADRMVVTWLNVPEHNGSNQNTLQIELYLNGQVKINYLAVAATDGLAGLSAGGGVSPDFYMSDLSALGSCQTYPPVAQNGMANTNQSTPVNVTLAATDDGMPNPPGYMTYTLASLPVHGGISDPQGGAIQAVPYTLLNGGKIVHYTPHLQYVGTDTFQFLANDGGTPPDGGDSNVATITVTMVGVPQLAYSFPLDTDPGWTKSYPLWAFGVPAGLGTHAEDPTSGHTGSNVYGYNLNGDYTNGMPARNLTTTALDCSNFVGVELRFWRWLGVEQYDHAAVAVSNNGTTWTTMWDSFGTTVNESAWSQQVYSIAATADHQPTVYIRWIMGTTDTSNTYPGWNIDDVELWGLAPPEWSVGDLNCDGAVSFADINAFVLALSSPSSYATAFLDCDIMNGDINGDGSVGFADINPFVNCLSSGHCP